MLLIFKRIRVFISVNLEVPEKIIQEYDNKVS